jgi:mono/diheme cytochrome c family protein
MGSAWSWKGNLEAKEKIMNQDKPQHHMIFGALIFLALFVGLTLHVVPIVEASPGPDRAASSATFRTKCAMCHGQDGGGSEVGKSMNVPDLRSPAVQKLSDAQVAQIISNGKGGMPSFKNSLSEAQIHSLVTYIRSLHHPAIILRGREGTL